MAIIWQPTAFLSQATHVGAGSYGCGRAVALSPDGSRLFVAAQGQVAEFVADPGGYAGWTLIGAIALLSAGDYPQAMQVLAGDGELYAGDFSLDDGLPGSYHRYGSVLRATLSVDHYVGDGAWFDGPEHAPCGASKEMFGYYGWGMALSGNGLVLAVGQPGQGGRHLGAADLSCGFGAIWMFTRASTSDPWVAAPAPEKAIAAEGVPPYLTPAAPDPDRWTEQDFFGCALALNEDGSRCIVGEVGHWKFNYEGNVFIFDQSGGAWLGYSQVLRGSNASSYNNRLFGWSVCGTPDLSRIFVGAPYADNERGTWRGTVFVYDADEGADPDERYSLAYTITSPVMTNAPLPLPNVRMVRGFGAGVSCDSTGERVVIGASDVVTDSMDVEQEILPNQDNVEGVVFLWDLLPEPEPTDEEKREREPEVNEYNEPGGSTAVLFPYRPLVPVTESLAWTTDVVQAYDGTESRRGARAIPRQGWDWRVHVQDQAYYPLFRGWQTNLFWVPTWHESVIYAGAITATDTILTIAADVTDHGEWLDYLAIWYAPGWCELVGIASIVGTTVTLATQVQQNYPAGSTVMPARLCRMGAQVRADYAAPWALIDLSWVLLDAQQIEPFQLDDAELLGDLPVAEDGILPRSLTASTEELDFGTGVLGFDAPRPESTWATDHRYYHTTRSDCWDRRLWLYATMGQRGGFWVPSGRQDLTLAAPFAGTDTELVVRRLNYYEWLFSEVATDRVLFFQRVGEADSLCRVVTDVEDAAGEFQTITLADPLGFDGLAESFCCISWLLPCRLAADRIELAWESPERMSLVLPVREVHPYSVQV